MLDGDIVADRRDDGAYIIQRWRANDGGLLPIDGHEDLYDEEEMYRRLNVLRSTGDTYVRDQPTTACPSSKRCSAHAKARTGEYWFGEWRA